MATREEVYSAIDSERDYQDSEEFFFASKSKENHTVTEWIVFIQNSLDEAKHYVSRNSEDVGPQSALGVIRRITAMGVVCMEQNGVPTREGY